jgi:hypothetical protein
MIEMYGQDEVDRLIRLAGTVNKINRADLEEKIEHYQMCLETVRSLKRTGFG